VSGIGWHRQALRLTHNAVNQLLHLAGMRRSEALGPRIDARHSRFCRVLASCQRLERRDRLVQSDGGARHLTRQGNEGVQVLAQQVHHVRQLIDLLGYGHCLRSGRCGDHLRRLAACDTQEHLHGDRSQLLLVRFDFRSELRLYTGRLDACEPERDLVHPQAIDLLDTTARLQRDYAQAFSETGSAENAIELAVRKEAKRPAHAR
jgi:hypothetical protein